MRTTTQANELTERQIKRYVTTGGVACPFCGAEAIEGGPVDIDAGSAYQDVTCTACGREWTDSYALAGVI